MPNSQNTPNIPLPKVWTEHVRSAVVHVLSLAQFAAVYSRSWAVDSMNGRVQLKADNDRLLQDLDHLSRRSMGFAVFDREPDAVSIRCLLPVQFFKPPGRPATSSSPSA